MLKNLWNINKAEYWSHCNSFIGAISRFVPKLANSDTTYAESKLKNNLGIAAQFVWLFLEVLKKTMYCAIFLLLPQMLFSRYMAVGSSGFAIDNSFVYFALIMSCFCGSIINSKIFDYNQMSYTMLKIVRVNPRNYFRTRLLRKSVMELVSFTVALTVCGMNFIKALFLAIIIVLSRYAGETFNIMIYRITRKTVSEIKGFNVIIMFASLLLAYFVPYIRGCVPNAYSFAFGSVFFTVFLVLSSLFVYYVWNYNGYGKISARLYTIANLKARYEEDEELVATTNTDDHIRQPEKETYVGNVYGFEYLNRIFFVRNRRKIIEGIIIRAAIILVVLAVAVIAAIPMGNGEVVYKVITFSPSVLVFVMYVMSSGSTMNKTMFTQCDSEMLKHRYYRDRENQFGNFLIRLRYMAIIDMIPAIILSAAFVVAGLVSGQTEIAETLIFVCASVIVLACIFAAYNLLMYYVFQPFDENGEVNSKLYSIINTAMYLIAYVCVFVNTTPVYFTCITAGILAVVLAAGATLVYKFGPARFRL